MKRWKAIIGVVIIFVLGAAAGALVMHGIDHQRIDRFLRGEPGMTRDFIVNRLNRELNLDAAQLEQLRTIVQETHAAMRDVRKQYRPQTEEILKMSQDRVRAILRPDQLEKFNKIAAERKRRHGGEENEK